MKDFLTFLVTSLVEKPDQVSVQEQTLPEEITFTISVDKDDMDRIIGKGGKVIGAIRQLVKIIAIKQGLRVNIQLTEDAH